MTPNELRLYLEDIWNTWECVNPCHINICYWAEENETVHLLRGIKHRMHFERDYYNARRRMALRLSKRTL